MCTVGRASMLSYINITFIVSGIVRSKTFWHISEGSLHLLSRKWLRYRSNLSLLGHSTTTLIIIIFFITIIIITHDPCRQSVCRSVVSSPSLPHSQNLIDAQGRSSLPFIVNIWCLHDVLRQRVQNIYYSHTEKLRFYLSSTFPFPQLQAVSPCHYPCCIMVWQQIIMFNILDSMC